MIHQRLVVATVILGAAAAAVAFRAPEPATAQPDYTRIRAANENSIVFIHSKRTRKDGVGAPDESHGTGFIISQLGYVLTASHVILKADALTVVETEGTIRSRHNPKYKLELVKRDDDIDAALLLFPDIGVNWKSVEFGDSRGVPKDAPLYALGFPGNLDLAPATGILSNRFGPKGNWQTTLGINRGQSGGPVFDLNAKVVAIAAAGIDVYQGVTFAIPEAHVFGLRQLAAAPPAGGTQFVQSPTTPEILARQRFVFYRAVDHEAQTSAKELYCLPREYLIHNFGYHVTTQNGPETKLVSVGPDQTAKNCVAVEAFIKGAGVTKVGPITVDHKGRGWLGVEVNVEGKKVVR
jgi:hypothetical protein